jgi:uncharacterized protein DUF3306
MSTDFLQRWSRRKHAAAASTAPGAASPQPLPALPALEGMTFDSDFKAFMHAKVDEGVRRAALQKLFSDPRFNVMDGLDTYIDDYTKSEPIPEAMLATLEHARQTLFGPKKEEPAAEEQVKSEPQKPDVDPAQDPKAV